MKRVLILFLALVLVVPLFSQVDTTFTIGSITAKRGEKVVGKLIVEDGVDKGTFIPVTIINGINPGPVIALTAGIHGTEYVPIIALQEIKKEIDPKDLSGKVILVHIANIPAFINRSVYVSDIDQKNLNRVFPGKKDGTISERIAYTITNEIISKSNYYIDLHGGEFHESLVNFLYFFYGCPENDLCKKSRMMAHAMGNNYLNPIRYDAIHSSLTSDPAVFVAFRKGVASILAEFGDQGKVDSENLELTRKGVINVLRTIGMLEGKTFKNEYPLYLDKNLVLRSNNDGIFYSCIDKGLSFSQGTLLGYLTDFWGNTIEEYRSPFSGIVLRTTSSPSVKKGEVVLRIGSVSNTFELE